MKALFRNLAFPLLAAMLNASAGIGAALAKDCDSRYFGIDEHGRKYPSAIPHPGLADTLRKARAGNAADQRTLASYYEIGYMVSRCDDKAVHWYSRAADAGDSFARHWLYQRQAGARPETHPGGEQRIAVLFADTKRGDHFFAPVTINGMTLQGLIDTGASTVAMSHEVARQFGLDVQTRHRGSAQTANGKIVASYIVAPQIDIAGIKARNVPVTIGITDGVLIGMSFLRHVGISIHQGKLTMTAQP